MVGWFCFRVTGSNRRSGNVGFLFLHLAVPIPAEEYRMVASGFLLVLRCFGHRAGERQTDRQRQRDRVRVRDRQTDTDRDRQTETETQRETDRDREAKETETDTDRHRHRQTDTHRQTETDRQKHRERQTEIERKRDRDRQRHRERAKETDRTNKVRKTERETGLFSIHVLMFVFHPFPFLSVSVLRTAPFK